MTIADLIREHSRALDEERRAHRRERDFYRRLVLALARGGPVACDGRPFRFDGEEVVIGGTAGAGAYPDAETIPEPEAPS